MLTGQDRSYSTIQAALDAWATTGSSTVTIANGNYSESPVIKDSGLTVSVGATAYSGASGTSPLTFTLDTGVANATVSGAGAANLTGNTGNNALVGNGAANSLLGDAGTDTLTGGNGANVINGGAGVDTATYSGAFADYTDVLSGADSLGLSNAGSVISDSISNVEVLDFTTGGDARIVGWDSEYATLEAAITAASTTSWSRTAPRSRSPRRSPRPFRSTASSRSRPRASRTAPPPRRCSRAS
jgi:Ca2+-binding RTX toxin-like protein